MDSELSRKRKQHSRLATNGTTGQPAIAFSSLPSPSYVRCFTGTDHINRRCIRNQPAYPNNPPAIPSLPNQQSSRDAVPSPPAPPSKVLPNLLLRVCEELNDHRLKKREFKREGGVSFETESERAKREEAGEKVDSPPILTVDFPPMFTVLGVGFSSVGALIQRLSPQEAG